jgi:tetraacyldisaccharide 4'-kinase
MKPPGFWHTGGPLAAALAPLGIITRIATARRVAQPGYRAPVPVICCGNASVGGAGKTPLCLDILARLRAAGLNAHALTRGHGGTLPGPVRVDPQRHTAAEVGDEALLLAQAAPCWAGANRAASARAALEAGAQLLVMDDGLQNPSLVKTCSLLTIDGGAGFGNNRLLPAGPLREPVAAAARRCAAAVLIGPDAHNAAALLPPGLPVLHATLVPGPDMLSLSGQRAYAFAGIGRPGKFFATLEQAGIVLAGAETFADHHPYYPAELAALRQRAATLNAVLVTTTKDHARLPPAERAGVRPLAAALQWEDPGVIEALLRKEAVLF